MKDNRVLFPEKGLLYGYLTPLLTISIIVILIIITAIGVSYRFREDVGNIIAEEVVQLAKIFDKIEKQCNILGFDEQTTRINFLNVKHGGFEGSEIGSMNLAHPDKWGGPYLIENPKIEGREYIIVNTKKGYFITPGIGVVLPDGKTIGKDIIVDEHADIHELMQEGRSLNYKGRPLAAPLVIIQKPALGMDPEEFLGAQREWEMGNPVSAVHMALR